MDFDSRDFSQDKLGPCLLEGFNISVLLGDRRRNVAQSKHGELLSKRSLNKVILPFVPQTAPKHKGANNNISKTLKLALLNVRSLAGKHS